jgi:hypothetical protein
VVRFRLNAPGLSGSQGSPGSRSCGMWLMR